MASPVLTVNSLETLEDAALRMQERKLGGMPVLDNAGALVGILTITDVLGALVRVLGLKEGGVRVTLEVPDTPGALGVAVEAIKPSNILSVATAGLRDGQRRFVLRVNGEGLDGLADRLRAAGIALK